MTIHGNKIGESMNDEIQGRIRCDRLGRADVNCYLARARELRAAIYRGWYHSVRNRLARVLCRPLFGCSEAATG